MTLFRNDTHQELCRQRWCETCFQPDEAQRRIQGKDTQCPIWERALRTGRKPVQWDRMPRADEMQRSIRCNAYAAKPALTKIRAASNPALPDDEPALFDVGEFYSDGKPIYVPVVGWPDHRSRSGGGVDHA